MTLSIKMKFMHPSHVRMQRRTNSSVRILTILNDGGIANFIVIRPTADKKIG